MWKVRRQTLQIRTSEGLQVEADPARIRQVLMHLVLNAIRFTPDEGAIEFPHFVKTTTYRFPLHDTGIGIEDAKWQGYLMSFTKARPISTITRGRSSFSREGSGWGLRWVKGIIEEHGGKIWVESERSRGGYGSTFHFTLPL